MTLTSEIIRDAYRESNAIALGASPTANQSTEALTMLNRLVSGAYGNEVGDPFLDWPIGLTGVVENQSWAQTDWSYLLGNVRIVAINDSAQTLYLPPDPDPGARVALIDPNAQLATYPVTIMGNGRTIQGAASQLIDTPSTNKTWFYRDDLGDWVLLSELTNAVDEDFPFPEEFDDYFITKLAMRINPRYGRSLSDESAITLEAALRRLRARYRQTQVIPTDIGVLNLTTGYGGSARGPIARGRMGWMV